MSEEPRVSEESRPEKRKPLVSHRHKKQSVTKWLAPLALIVALMIFLPKLLALLE